MGLFKGMKDMKDMVNAAPGLVDQAQQMQANAQALAQQQAAAAQAAAATAAPAAPLTGEAAEPIAGVSLEQYATISRGLAAYGYDQSKAVQVAAEHGLDAASWEAAVAGWNQRIQTNPTVAQAFNRLYTGR